MPMRGRIHIISVASRAILRARSRLFYDESIDILELPCAGSSAVVAFLDNVVSVRVGVGVPWTRSLAEER